jgi:hypothetical protein
MAFYKWDRIFDSGISDFVSSGIVALGKTGLLRPVENKQMPMNVELHACVPYFDGYLLIMPGLMLYINAEGQISENKIDLALTDGVFINGMILLATTDGKILFSKEPLVFKEHSRRLNKITRVNKCEDKAIICGDTTIAIAWEKDNRVEFKQLATHFHHINAYLYDGKIFSFSDDGFLNVYFIDKEFNILPNSLYRIDINSNLIDATVNSIYIDHDSKTCDIYFLCNNGIVAVIPNFKYTKDSITEIDKNLIMYEAKLTDNSYFKDMTKYNDEYIIVGYGEETKSCIKTKQLKDSIIAHNLLNRISGPERYMHNFASTYESKYKKSKSEDTKMKALLTVHLIVYTNTDGSKYIKTTDIGLIPNSFTIYDVQDAISTEVFSNIIPVDTDKPKCKVTISISEDMIERCY